MVTMHLSVIAIVSARTFGQVLSPWTYQGCYFDNVSNRTLAQREDFDNGDQTIEACMSTCSTKRYNWAGLEYASECWCDSQLPPSATKAVETDCFMSCTGNSSQRCGSADRVSVYWNGIDTIINPGPEGWSYLSCFTDDPGSRTLGHFQLVSGSMTVAGCTAACESAGYPLAGLEYAGECFCDDSIHNPGIQVESGCNMPCQGNSSEYCGGSGRLTIYQVAGFSTPLEGEPPATPPGWTGLGCYTDEVGNRSLASAQDAPGGSTNMTIEGCLGACAKLGFAFAGTEFSQECFCGNQINSAGSCATDQASCNMACRGDKREICGASNRINIYYSGTASGLAVCSNADASTSTSSTPTISASLSSSTTSTLSTATPSTSSGLVTSTSTSTSVTTSTFLTSSTTSRTSTISSSTACPTFWSAVVADLAPAMKEDGQCNDLARAAIRYAFHDAASFSNKLTFYEPAAGGADGSLLLSATEIDRIDHDGLRDYHATLKQKFDSYKSAGYEIGAADLIQVAGAIATLTCPGGRFGRIMVGRKDTDVAAPGGLLPQAFGIGSDHDTIYQLFLDKGFTARDLAALIGAHSTSKANFQTSHGIPAGSSQDSTPGTWDINYYNETYYPPGGTVRSFDSDVNLAKNTTTVGRQFQSFVGSQAAWGASYASAIQAMSLLGVPNSVRAVMRDCTIIVSNGVANA